MGTPLPDQPIDYGDDCVVCRDAPYERWAAGETPHYVYVRFSGLVKCVWGTYEPPNGQVFRLEQDPVWPCLWFLIGTKWTVQFLPATRVPLLSQIVLRDEFAQLYFDGFSVACPPEMQVFDNSLVACNPGNQSKDGEATIAWNSTALSIAKAMVLPFDPQLMTEMFITPTDVPVFKYCNPRFGVNVKIKFEPF